MFLIPSISLFILVHLCFTNLLPHFRQKTVAIDFGICIQYRRSDVLFHILTRRNKIPAYHVIVVAVIQLKLCISELNAAVIQLKLGISELNAAVIQLKLCISELKAQKHLRDNSRSSNRGTNGSKVIKSLRNRPFFG